jgi:hypothetical protein
MPPEPLASLSRRRFLLGTGAVASAALLGGCETEDGDVTSSDLSLVPHFGGAPMLSAGGDVRAPFGIADTEGLLSPSGTPASLELEVFGPDGAEVLAATTVARHVEGLPHAYFPLRFTADRAGIYTARTELDGGPLEMSVKVDRPDDVTAIKVGEGLPAAMTPTTTDPRGVEPMCTRDPVCPLHDVTVASALEEARPLALLVSTPAFCQIAVCGPVLEVLLGVADAHTAVRLLHAEVYSRPYEERDTKAPVVGELGLTFEPCLVLADAEGTVVERLDTIFDEAEVDRALAQLH